MHVSCVPFLYRYLESLIAISCVITPARYPYPRIWTSGRLHIPPAVQPAPPAATSTDYVSKLLSSDKQVLPPP